MRRMSIKPSILLPVIAVLAVGIIIMTIIVGSISSSTVNDLSGGLISARVNEYSNKFEAMCGDSYGMTIALASIIRDVGAAGENPREEAITILAGVLQASENLVSIWTVWEPDAFDGKDGEFAGTLNHDGTGRFCQFVLKDGDTYSVGFVPDYETGDYYLGARGSGKPYMTDPYECEFNGEYIPIYTITVPIIKDGEVAGAVGVDIDLGNMIGTINAGTILDEGYLFVISPGGLIASHRNSDMLLRPYASMWLRDFKTELNSLSANGGAFAGSAYSDLLDEEARFLASGVMIGDTGRYWAVCGVIPERIVSAQSARMIWNVIFIGAGLTAMVGLTVFFIVRGKLKRLPVIKAAAEAMARGEIELAGLDTGDESTRNEISLLERAFLSMADGIKKQAGIMTQLAGGDYSVTASVRCEADAMNKAINNLIEHANEVMAEILVSSEQVSIGSKQIASGAQSLARGSTEQASAIEELSASIGEIAEKTRQNAGVAKEAADLSSIIRTGAEKGGLQMKQMMRAVEEINEAGGQIRKVIKVIDDIAFQTNILALNAAVEAARAGPAGKSFSVVAEEVRHLASKSAEAAKDTGALIENSIEKANLGLGIATETASSLNEIVAGIKRSAEIVANIAQSSDEQAAAIAQINIGIGQVAQVVQQNSSSAEESAAASEEMSGQSDMLAQLISQFKLKDEGSASSLPSESNPRQKAIAMPKKEFYARAGGDYGKY